MFFSFVITIIKIRPFLVNLKLVVNCDIKIIFWFWHLKYSFINSLIASFFTEY